MAWPNSPKGKPLREHPDTLSSMHNLAIICDDLDEAARLEEEVLKKRRQILGESQDEDRISLI